MLDWLKNLTRKLFFLFVYKKSRAELTAPVNEMHY